MGNLGWISGKGSPRGWSDTDQAPHGSGHRPKAARAQGAFEQCSQDQGGIVGLSSERQELDLMIPLRIFDESMFRLTAS